MTTSLRLAAAPLCVAFACLSPLLAAQTAAAANPPVVIERAPEPTGAQLERELAELRAENRRLATDLENAFTANERLQAELDAGATAKTQDETALKETARELAMMRAKIARLESTPNATIAELQKQSEATQATLEELAAKNRQLEATLAARTNELSDAQARLAEAAAARTTQQANTVAEQKRVAEDRARATSLETQLTQLRTQHSALETQLAEARDASTALREQLAAEKARAASTPDLSGRLAQTENQLAEASRSLAALQAENARLTAAAGEKERLAAELEKLRAENATLTSERAAAPSPDLAPQLAEVEGKLADVEGKLSTALRSYTLLQEENEKLKATASTQTETLAGMDELRRQNAELEARLAAQPPPAPDLSPKLAETENRLNTTLRSFTLLQKENEQLKSAASAQDDTRTELENTRREKAELEARLAAQPPPAPDLSAKLAETEDRLNTTLRSYALLQTENEQLKAAGAVQGDSQPELEELRRRNTELETQLTAQQPATPDLSGKLTETEDKLNTVLRSYSLLQREHEQVKADAARAATEARNAAARSAAESAAQISALFDELRQTQAQVAARAAENSQLKTRLALVGTLPGSAHASPARPSANPAAQTAPSAPPAASPEASTPTEPRTHLVVAGDNLAKISRTYYGTANRWDEILEANRDVIQNENVLPLGATLRIP